MERSKEARSPRRSSSYLPQTTWLIVHPTFTMPQMSPIAHSLYLHRHEPLHQTLQAQVLLNQTTFPPISAPLATYQHAARRTLWSMKFLKSPNAFHLTPRIPTRQLLHENVLNLLPDSNLRALFMIFHP